MLRAIPLWSEELGLSGRADAVEVEDGAVRPVEYKAGVRHGAAADLQLCAQALCLEEMLDVEIPHGYVWYGGPRRRLQVDFTEALRQEVRDVIDRIRTQLLKVRVARGAQRCSMQGVPTLTPLPAGTIERPPQGEPVHGKRCLSMRYLSTVYVRNHRARVRHRRGPWWCPRRRAVNGFRLKRSTHLS